MTRPKPLQGYRFYVVLVPKPAIDERDVTIALNGFSIKWFLNGNPGCRGRTCLRRIMSSLPKPLGQPWVAIIVSRFLVPAFLT